MLWQNCKFGITVFGIEVTLIILFTFFVNYAPQAELVKKNVTHTGNTRNMIQDYYPMFQDVNVMIFIGFGFLMTFLKKYGFSAIGLNMLLAAVSIQWAIFMKGIWNMVDGKIPVNIISLINGNFASATVLISYGALLGKTSPLQLVVMTIIEIAIFACNEHLGVSILKAVDIGGSIFLHTFGAYFGLGVSYMLYQKDYNQNTKEGSNYHSDIFAMIGTVFLWLFWPSFNAALAVGEEQHRTVINTYVSLLACCVVTFAWSAMVNGEGRLNMVHIQNATLAGGVAIGASANMNVHIFGAMIIGSLSGILSTAGYKMLTPFLANKLQVHDTCGVNNLHGMPGVFAGLTSAVVAVMASENNYGYSMYQLYPARVPAENTTLFHQIHGVIPNVQPGYNWTETGQAIAQLEALFSTLAIAFFGGMVTGYIIRNPVFDPPKKLQLFDDTDYWEVPDEEHF